MHGTIVEVKNAVLHTYEGDALEVHGGAYLSPEAYLATNSEIERLREKGAQQDERSHLVPALMLGAALAGLAAGFWLARRDDD